jgi:hypothetical protein
MIRNEGFCPPFWAKYLLRDPFGIRTTHPHNADAAFSMRRGYGSDGVVFISLKHHVYITISRDKNDVKVTRVFRPKIDGKTPIGKCQPAEHKA